MASGIGKPGVPVRVLLPDATDGTDSREFVVPEGSKVMVVHVPALVGVASTLKLQAQERKLTDAETAVWGDITVFNLTDGTFTALDGLPESTVVTIPVSAIGPGPLRFVASAAQTGAIDAITIPVLFGRDG